MMVVFVEILDFIDIGVLGWVMLQSTVPLDSCQDVYQIDPIGINKDIPVYCLSRMYNSLQCLLPAAPNECFMTPMHSCLNLKQDK